MHKTLLRIGGVLIACTLVLGACSDDDDDGDAASNDTDTTAAVVTTVPAGSATTAAGGATTAPPTGSTAANTVTIKGFAFTSPPVKAGSKVTVKNEDSVTHTYTADDKSFDSGRVDGGKSAQFTAPSNPGDYKVHCEIHTSMTGTLTVT